MKKKIGILVRPNLDRYTLNREICDVITSHNCIPIGIVPTCKEGTMTEESLEDMIQMLTLCDGVILQGGKDFYEYDLKTVRYLYDHDIPTLGICLGMQTIGCLFGGMLKPVEEHHSTVDYVHEVTIEKDSKLYSIIQKETIIVNSRHHQQVVNTHLHPVAYASDIVEAIEDSTKRFFIGVEWHPESIDDENSQALFQAFFDTVQKNPNC